MQFITELVRSRNKMLILLLRLAGLDLFNAYRGESGAAVGDGYHLEIRRLGDSPGQGGRGKVAV